SLVELLLFTGIVALMAGTLVGVSIVSSDISGRSETRAEVEQNGSLLIQRLIQEIESSDYIAYPPEGQSSKVIILAGLQHDPNREVFIDLHHDRVRMIENGSEVTFITTEDVGVTQIVFFNNTNKVNGGTVSVAFQIQNKALGTEVMEGSYNKNFRATASVLPYKCLTDADCTDQTCCGGICRDACLADCVPGGCPTGQVCCITDNAAGTASCVVPASCANAECECVDDCPVEDPYFLIDEVVIFCDLATCDYKIPVCTANECVNVTIGKCDVCSQCGDGWADIAAGEECDDGNINNNDSCTNGCRLSECGDGIIRDDGVGGTELCSVVGDEDLDGDPDCEDSECPDGTSCGANGRECSGDSCDCPGGSTESNCTDTNDNDCDGLTDCNDSDCSADPTCAAVCGNWLLEGAEGCDDGNTSDGDGCSSVCANEDTCASCDPCGTSAVKWELTVESGLTGSCTGGEGNCADFSVTSYELDRYVGLYCSSCEYCWYNPLPVACGGPYSWRLKWHDGNNRWELDAVETSMIAAVYVLDSASWNCNDTNIMTLDSFNDCSGWPATATLNPVGALECSTGPAAPPPLVF
ncbi:hypothetical protein HOF56_04195, partial [Candidatus Peribacteria bacterium]|nr:hypothetical protein [Candidatus Peribacteria bacterium]MBT4021736.1 hypothetical protein [Candidatus Peribacteria bacterium]MBT4240413.1 hypothetical protein [Candidatus Peribacteria bacterium]MBT4474046.1 hypothetical protein [Candidatus Peribacteria bacterium]